MGGCGERGGYKTCMAEPLSSRQHFKPGGPRLNSHHRAEMSDKCVEKLCKVNLNRDVNSLI